MKWGVRKDRRGSGSSNGSRLVDKISSGAKTAKAQIARAKQKSKIKKNKKQVAKQKMTDQKTRNPKKMSDAELKKRIERLELEKKYRSLSSADISKGKKVVENMLSKSAENIGTQLTTYLMGEAVNKAFREIMKAADKPIGDNEKIVNPRKGQKDK